MATTAMTTTTVRTAAAAALPALPAPSIANLRRGMSALAMEQDGGAAAPAGRAGGAPSLEAAVGGASAVSGVAVVWVVCRVASSCRRVVVPRVPCSISNGFRNLFYFVLSSFYLSIFLDACFVPG